MADNTVLDALAIFVVLKKKKRQQRRMWSKDWLLKRNTLSHTNLLQEIRAFPEDFQNFLRMDEETYLHLLSLVTPLISKKSTVMRPAISVDQK